MPWRCATTSPTCPDLLETTRLHIMSILNRAFTSSRKKYNQVRIPWALPPPLLLPLLPSRIQPPNMKHVLRKLHADVLAVSVLLAQSIHQEPFASYLPCLVPFDVFLWSDS